MRFYLAGPFFNLEQRQTMEKIEHCARQLGVDFYSPRLECLCPPNASQEVRQKTFRSNVENLETARTSFVLARIDDFDPGTMWEIGYAYGEDQNVFAFTTVEGRGLNLMLAQSCVGFLQGLPEVYKFLEEAKTGQFGRAQKWKKTIV